MERTPPPDSRPRREAPQPRREPPASRPSGAPSEREKDDAQLDHELEQTFPASDPIPPKHVD